MRSSGSKRIGTRGIWMEQDLQNTIALLERTPGTLSTLLRGLPEMWTKSNEGENTWSVRTVGAHLIHAENEDWIPRARVILKSGEEGVFAPFDRDGHVGYSRGKILDQLLDEFAQARAKGLGELRALKLTAEDLKRRGR